jgi:hypothetical protein
MATDTIPTWRRRLRRPALPDLLIAAVVVVLAAAVVVNGMTTVHDTKRVRLDREVAGRWFRDHAELGRFGPARIKVQGNHDLVCKARGSKGASANPVDGYCIVIEDRGIHSTRILDSYRCYYPRAAQLGMPTQPRCLARH